MNINQFKAQLTGGGARTNLFIVSITRGNASIQGLANVPVLCNQVTLPESQIAPATARFMGRPVNFVGERNYTHTVQLTLLNDNEGLIRSAMEKWNEEYHNTVDLGASQTYEGFADGIIKIKTFKRTEVGGADLLSGVDAAQSGKTIYEFTGAYPENISAISLDATQINTMQTFTVTFKYITWQLGEVTDQINTVE